MIDGEFSFQGDSETQVPFILWLYHFQHMASKVTHLYQNWIRGNSVGNPCKRSLGVKPASDIHDFSSGPLSKI